MRGMYELATGIYRVAHLPVVYVEFIVQELRAVLMADHHSYFLFFFLLDCKGRHPAAR